jgi:serine/threonine protein kinase
MPTFTPDQLIDNRYRIKENIGKGGFADVYRAEDTKANNTEIAIKVLAPQSGLSSAVRNSYINEFTNTLELSHQYLLTPKHYGEYGETCYIVMPLCRNGSLDNCILESNNPATHNRIAKLLYQGANEEADLAEKEIAKILHQTASALEYIHKNGFTHNDIKPGNILLGNNGDYLLSDFGISSKTRTTAVKNSVDRSNMASEGKKTNSAMSIAYAATELFGDYPLNTSKTDIFSLGVTLYEIATGNLPWLGQGGIVLNKGASIPNLSNKYSNQLNKIIRRCMDTVPENRPTTLELTNWSKHYLENGFWGADSLPVQAQIAAASSPTPDPKRKWLPFLIGILGAIVIFWLGYNFFFKGTPMPATPISACNSPLSSKIASSAKGLIIAKEGEAPPMFWCDDYDKFPNCQGFEFEFGQMLVGKLGIDKVSYSIGEYDDLPDLVKNEKAHIILAGYVPDSEISGIDWSDSYLDFGLCLIVKKGSQIKELSDLNKAGKKVVAYEGDATALDWVKTNIPNANVIEEADPAEESGVWMKGVVNGKIAAAIYDYPFAVAELAESYPSLQIVKVNLNSSHYAVGLPSGNLCFKEKINQAISELKVSTRYADLVKKYLKTDALAVSTKIASDARVHIVKEGETLSFICETELGDLNKWGEVWHLPENFERFPNPHLINVGDKIVLPKN